MEQALQTNRPRNNRYSGFWLALGIALEAGLGVVFKNFAVGIGVGVALESMNACRNRLRQ